MWCKSLRGDEFSGYTPGQSVEGVFSSASAVNPALVSGNRDNMPVLAAALDAGNNLGCPLN